jgi:hypothetical protein
MDRFVDGIKGILIVMLVPGITIYGLFMLVYAFAWSETATKLMKSGDPSYMFGLPISAVAAFGVVALLDRFAPATEDASGKLEFKAFGLTFSGPARPVTLWVIVYLVLIASPPRRLPLALRHRESPDCFWPRCGLTVMAAGHERSLEAREHR